MKRFTAETFAKYRHPSSPLISPDGRLTAFVLTETDLEKNCYRADLWVLENETGTVRRLTAQGDAFSFAWTPDGRIVFAAPRGDEVGNAKKEGRMLTRYFVISPWGGEAEALCTLPIEGGAPHILPDGKWVVTGKVDLNRPDFDALPEKERQKALKEYLDPCCRIFEEVPWWSNGRGDISGIRTALYLCDPAAGTAQKVTSERFNVATVVCDCGRVIYTGEELHGLQTRKSGVFELDPVTGQSRILIEPGTYTLHSTMLFDHNTVFEQMTDDSDHPYANGSLYAIDIDSGKMRRLGAPEDSLFDAVNTDAYMGGGRSFKPDGGKLWVTVGDGDNCRLHTMDADGQLSSQLTGPGSVQCFDVRGGQVVMAAMRGNQLAELYSLDPNGGEKQLTHFNDWVQEQYAVSTPQPISFTDPDGFDIHGWVMEPAGYEPGKKYPCILNIHGGPRGAYGTVFFHEMQLWASRGYFVIFCNPRGSSGRGFDFVDLYGKYGDTDYKNLMQFADVCLEKVPDIDKDNLCVTGGSYGGYMVNWMIGHTNRFRAACAQRSISDWIAYQGTSDLGSWFNLKEHGADIEHNIELLWEISPLKHAKNAQTPTLFIHADEDYRCYMVHAYEMFTALRRNGVDSRIVLFKGENHGLSRGGKPQARVRRMNEIIDWMDAHLQK